jgi:hypothetical protein
MAAQQDALGLDVVAIDAIRLALLRGVADPNFSVRAAAVMSLGTFDDTAVRDAMRRASIVDNSEQVRNAADEWLEKHRP